MQIVRLTQTAPKRRKLLQVDPYPRENPYHLGPSERKAIWFPKLSLPAIAAYTPEHWDVEIQDEAVREIDLECPADLVGISVMTDRKSTRLNSSHPSISYAVFCLKKKNK